MRRAVALIALVAGAATLLPACTTSRAVRAWHAAEDARRAGDRAVALRRYEEAYGRDGKLVGAEVDRIALLAQDVGSAAAVESARSKLVEKKAGRVEVQLLGAGLELVAGRHAAALAQLESIGDVALDQAEAEIGVRGAACGPLRRERWRLLGLAALHTGRSAAAKTAAAALREHCRPLRGAESAVVAWVALRAGDQAAAQAAVAEIDPADRATAPLRAALALRRGDPEAASKALRGAEDGAASLLRAQAALMRSDAAGAARAVAAARDAGGPAAELAPLEGALALLQGDPRRGRDLLAGAAAQQAGGARWTVLFDLGLCELRLGQLAAAREAFARAATACPTCPAPARNRDAIDRALGRLR